MGKDIIVSVQAKDFSAGEAGTTGSSPEYPGLTVTYHTASGHIEWKATLPRAGKYQLHALMTAAESRPCTLTINGAKQADPILGENTGGWQSDRLQWFAYGPYEFQEGENLIAIDFAHCQPHLKEFGFSPAEEQAATKETPWRAIASSGDIIGIAALGDGSLLGVGADGQLHTTRLKRGKPAINQWKAIPGSGPVIAVTQLHDGSLLGVGADGQLQTRATPTDAWTPVPGSQTVRSVAQLNDGTLLGVGADKQLQTRADLASPWAKVPDSGPVASAIQLADGRIVGAGTDGRLRARATLAQPWQELPDGPPLATLAQLPDGSLLGVGTDQTLHFLAVADLAQALPADEAGTAAAPEQERPAETLPQTQAQAQAPLGGIEPMAVAANAVKILGESAVLPGASLLMDGKILEGGAHGLLGLAALRFLGSTAGPAGWLLLAVNSYSKSASDRYLHQHIATLFKK